MAGTVGIGVNVDVAVPVDAAILVAVGVNVSVNNGETITNSVASAVLVKLTTGGTMTKVSDDFGDSNTPVFIRGCLVTGIVCNELKRNHANKPTKANSAVIMMNPIKRNHAFDFLTGFNEI